MEEGMSNHPADHGKMGSQPARLPLSVLMGSSRSVAGEKGACRHEPMEHVAEKTRWIVNLQYRIKGKLVAPLPGMDRLHATCRTRADARALVKACLPPRPGQRFVIRKEVET